METLPARSGTMRQAEKARRIDEGVVVRAMTSQDGDALRAMLDRLSPTTIYGRFHAAYRRVPGWMAAHLSDASNFSGGAFVAVVGEEVVGHAVCALGQGGTGAEAAIVVEDAWQSRGVGKLLLVRLATEARGLGVTDITGFVLPGNGAMLGLAHALGIEVRWQLEDRVYLLRASL